MSRMSLIAVALLSVAILGAANQTRAADLPDKPAVKAAKPVSEVPFFFINDNRLTYSYLFNGTFPGAYSVRPDGTINAKTVEQLYSFTHFDAWAYGTNFFTISMSQYDKNNPAVPCPIFGTNCAGTSEVYGLVRSTFGFNEIFDTKAFSYGALRNVSLEVGADAGTANNFLSSARRVGLAGLQFAFDLPYHGFFDVAPLAFKEIGHVGYLQCGFVPEPCLANGNIEYNPSWAVEINYYMDLGFLPENLRYFSISGRAGWYGKKGLETNTAGATPTAIELNSEPIRLTFDASKAVMGPKYSHFLDVWVAYRYWQNKFGLDHSASVFCNVSPGVSNNSCTEKSLYSGVTLKF